AIYLVYLWLSSIRESHEPELVGAAALIGSLPKTQRRLSVLFLFIYAAGIILVAAEPFVDALIETGTELGIDEFILIQWVAPLASEAPEIIVALLFSLRANPVAGLSTLISAEVNQLTLLIGTMVVVFSISAGGIHSFPLDHRQSVEFLLTSAVSVFAIVLLAPRMIGWRAGAALLVLFIAHLFFTDADQRLWFTYIYLGMAVLVLVVEPRRVTQAYRAVFE
ncbi:MAG: sodium/calcium exchanger protein, partial [Ardenticatenaceae bacterium]